MIGALVFTGLTTALVLAQTPPGPGEGRAPPADERPLQRDWLRLGSGEWLNGEFDGLRSGQVEFDSTRTGQRSWAFADVTDLLLHELNTFVFEDGSSMIGIGRLTEQELIVEGIRGERRYPRKAILSIVAADDTEIQHWDFRLSLGGNGRIGNGSQIQGTAEVRLRRRGRLSRFEFKSVLNVGFVPEDTGEPDDLSNLRLNILNTQADGNVDRYFTRRLFWSVITGFVRTDQFQNLLVRFQPGSQVGYDLIVTGPVTLSATLGASYQYAAYEEAFENGMPVDRFRNNVGPSFSARLGWAIAGNISFTLRNSSFIGALDPGLSTIDTSGALTVNLTRNLDFSIDATHRYQPTPVEPSSQTIVDSDLDLRFSLGLNFD